VDRAALFDALFDEHRSAVYAYLLGRTGNPEAAADQLQETFVRVWRNLDTALATPPDRRRFHCLAVARSVGNDAFRRSSRFPLTPLQDAPEMAQPETMTTNLMLSELDKALMTLPEDQRTMLAMQVMGSMSSAEIGKALGRPSGTVRYHLHQARLRLAQMLGLGEAVTK